jgi:hypothetical protein
MARVTPVLVEKGIVRAPEKVSRKRAETVSIPITGELTWTRPAPENGPETVEQAVPRRRVASL